MHGDVMLVWYRVTRLLGTAPGGVWLVRSRPGRNISHPVTAHLVSPRTSCRCRHGTGPGALVVGSSHCQHRYEQLTLLT